MTYNARDERVARRSTSPPPRRADYVAADGTARWASKTPTGSTTAMRHCANLRNAIPQRRSYFAHSRAPDAAGQLDRRGACLRRGIQPHACRLLDRDPRRCHAQWRGASRGDHPRIGDRAAAPRRSGVSALLRRLPRAVTLRDSSLGALYARQPRHRQTLRRCAGHDELDDPVTDDERCSTRSTRCNCCPWWSGFARGQIQRRSS